jgi:sugar-phosphatase
MDGLLIDTEPVWRRVEIEVFDRVGVHLTEEQCLETMGVPVPDVVRLWYGRHPWEGPGLEEVTRQIGQGVIEYVRSHGEPMPGVLAAVRAVHDAGLRAAVASSSSEEMIVTVLQRLGIGSCIDAIASADSEAAGKPDPAVYLTAARKLEVAPDACVALEDSPNGVVAAKAAGMYCILVPDPHLAHDPRMALADLTLRSMEEFSLDLLPHPIGPAPR